MRILLSLPLLLAALCVAANPIQARTSAAVPEAEDWDSGSIVDPDPQASAYQAPDPAMIIDRPAYKSQLAALGLSVLGTAAPILIGTQMSDNGEVAGSLIIGGLLVGPSLGQVYAGSLGGGMLGVGIRTGGAFMTLLGFAYMLNDLFCMETEGHTCEDKSDTGAPLMILGTAAYLGGAIYSLVDGGRAVERYNARLDHERIFGWSPILRPDARGGMRTGALAYLRF